MKLNRKLLILSLLTTIGFFVYLAIHHYSVRLGLGGSSLCEISSKVNCDAAAASSYSELFGIPIAVLGAFYTLILLCFIVFDQLKWVETSSYLKFTVRALLLGAVVVSITSGLYSIFVLKIICPFCVGTYILSLVNIILGWNVINTSQKSVKLDGYFGEYKSHLIALICIPLISWVVSGMIQSNYGLDLMKKRTPEFIYIWKSSPAYNFDSNAGLVKHVDNPKATIVEFADFKCPHCKIASNTLNVFLKAHPDIQFVFKPFPLDGNCNPQVSQKGDNSRCQFAAFALCAEKIAKKGWDVHHWLFENQAEFFQVYDAKTLIPQIQSQFNIDGEQLTRCSDSTEIFDIIKTTTEEAKMAQVEGTPTIYVNGKKLTGGHFLETLKLAIDEIDKKK